MKTRKRIIMRIILMMKVIKKKKKEKKIVLSIFLKFAKYAQIQLRLTKKAKFDILGKGFCVAGAIPFGTMS